MEPPERKNERRLVDVGRTSRRLDYLQRVARGRAMIGSVFRAELSGSSA
jgi:hypothetical protein